MRKVVFTCCIVASLSISALATEPVVAIHFSELTQALETIVARPPTPAGSGTTGHEWWTPWWHYFVMPESLKEALRSDGTPFVLVSDADISAGNLLSPDGTPRYPIVISLASEAIRDDEISQFRAYVAAGGFLLAGSSSFTRNPDGTSRGDFALAAEMGLNSASVGLENWRLNQTFLKLIDHRLVSHIPSGSLTWRMPLTSEDIPMGISPSHAQPQSHYIWQVSANDATVIAASNNSPYLVAKPYGLGTFIYHAGMQPLIGNGGPSPGMYAYGIFRNAIEWAFEAAGLPIIKISPWPYQYNAAYVVRHDYENLPWEIGNVALSAQTENSFGAKGDYYFCTGWLRDQMADSPSIVANLRSAVSLYGATIGPHNGGLKNPNNFSLSMDQYDYWHWGPDEALDVLPQGYASGSEYARASMSIAFADIDRWLTGLNVNTRTWVSPYFNSTRDESLQLLEQLGVVAAGEQKLSPFPHWTVSTQTPGKRFSFVSLPVSDWYIYSTIAQSMEESHDSSTIRGLVDYYYNLGALVNLYSHHSSHSGLPYEYVSYCASKPAIWPTNASSVSDWWTRRSPVQIVSSCSPSGDTLVTAIAVTGATDPDTAIELSIPNWAAVSSSLAITLNGLPAGQDSYRTYHHGIKVKVGTSVSVVQVSYIYAGTIAQDDNYSVVQGNTLRIATPGVLGNDIPGSISGLTATLESPVSEGTLAFQTDGSFEYSPRAGFIGADSFTYQAISGGVPSNTAIVTIMVMPLAVSLVALNPASVSSGSPSQGIVTLNGPALAGGTVVSLTSSVPAVVQVPASVTVAEGETTATFAVTTSIFPIVVRAAVDASYSGSSASALLTVSPVVGQVLFSDDFSGPSGNDPLWSTISGSWNVASGVMTGTSPANRFGNAIASGNWTDYYVRGRFLFPSGTFAGGIGGRVNPATGAHYGIWIYPTAFGSPVLAVVKFRTWTSWSGTFMARVSLPSMGTAWHTLMMAFQGNRIQVFYNENKLIDVTDNGFDSRPAYTSGGISLDLASSSSPRILNFDEILVTALAPAPVAALSAVSLSPATVLGGNTSTGTVTLDNPAPAGGAVVALSSSNTAAAQVPASVTVAAGAMTATFTATTSPVAADTAVTITGTYNSVTRTAALTVTAPTAPGQVLFSDDFSGPSGSNPLWSTISGSWIVASGVMTGTSPANRFGNAIAGGNWTDYSVRGRFMFPSGTFAGGIGGRVNPATGAHYGIWIYPSAFGSPALTVLKFRTWTSWSGTFMARVSLPSLGTGWHTLMMTFRGNRIQVFYDENQLIDVTDNGFDSRPAYMSGGISLDLASNSSPQILNFDDILATVLAPVAALSSVSLSPLTVLGGVSSTGTVTLDNPAPAGGAVVSLASSNTAAAQVPASVTVAAGATQATFTTTTSPVASNTSVTISGTYNGTTQTAALTVTAPVATLSAVSMSPASVLGGVSSTGTVPLDNPAPAGGAVVAFSSNDPPPINVPALE